MPINSQDVLVVGGAGYIGSHMVLALARAGFQPVVLDNLSTGHRDAVTDAELIVGDMSDKSLLTQLFSTRKFAAVMHFASCIEVGESVKNPMKYYQNNVAATLNLLEVMLEHDLKNFIFSSTAAVYGEPQSTPINESHPLAPINPYGRSKRMVEEIINDLASSDGLRYAILRYFNAAGADPQGLRGERHANESHLIPLVLQVASGKRSHVTLFGQDYPTPDGTCVRDYIHVTDLCDAHLAAMQKLCAGESSMICNLGTGAGYSVQQVIDIARMVTRQDISIVVEERRTGDPAILVADSFFARQKLGWQPKFPDLSTIIQHAWQFALTPCKS